MQELLPNWIVQYTVNFKRYTKCVGQNKRLAEDILAKLRVETLERRYFNKFPEVIWTEAVAMFLNWAEHRVSRNTALMYKAMLKNLGQSFEQSTLQAITRAEVNEHIKRRKNAGVSIATINREIATLRRMYALGEVGELWQQTTGSNFVDSNGIRSIRLLPGEQCRERFLTGEEIGRLLPQCHGHLERFVRIALNTGLRKGSILALDWKDIDFDNCLITVRVKGGMRKHFPMLRSLKDYLVPQRRKDGPLFPGKNGAAQKDIKKAFQSACKRAGLVKVRPHDLRHTFASHYLMRGGSLLELKELLGHATLRMVLHYAHLSKEYRKNRIEEILGQGW